jgi:hypothetical protein
MTCQLDRDAAAYPAACSGYEGNWTHVVQVYAFADSFLCRFLISLNCVAISDFL